MYAPENIEHIYYHKGCVDGYAAMLLAKKKYPNAEVHALAYNDIDQTYPDHSLFVDIAPRPQDYHSTLHIIDHHVSRYKEYLEHFGTLPDTYQYATDHSGCVYTGMCLDVYIPEIYYYVEDRDIWRWKLSLSKEVSAYISLMFSSSYVDGLPTWDFDASVEECQREGQLLTLADKGYLQRAKHYEVEFEGYKVRCANSTHLVSELGDSLAGDTFSIVWSFDGRYRVSLRSRIFDVSEIARKYGGGGHKTAAGFICDRLPWTY